MRAYLDHNATSPLLPAVRAAMEPWWGVPANAASVHEAGRRAAAALHTARVQVAALVGGQPEGVVFTSGATEANHLFVRGAWRRAGGGRWAVSALEHPCVLGACDAIAEAGAAIERLDVDAAGRVVLGALPHDTVGLSVMMANHETGVIQPVGAALDAARAVGAVLHVDATQAAGRMALDLGEVDGVVLSGHKLGGPPGIGALVLRDGEPFPPLLRGGAQERGRRAGTVPTVLAVGMGAACALALAELGDRQARWASEMDVLRPGLAALGAREVGAEPRVGNTLCVVFPGLRGESLVQALDLRGIAVSSGAACASGSLEPSPVLLAMGDPEPAGAVRISLGPRSDHAAVQQLLGALPGVLETVRLAAEWGEPAT